VLLAELEEKLAPTGRFKKAAVFGLGGIGKTQIALELAYWTRDKFPGRSVFWAPAFSREEVRKAFIDIGRHPNVPGADSPQADVSSPIQQRLGQESAGPWLLILDNADDVEVWCQPRAGSATSVRLIDYLPRSARGAILITTRSRKVAVQMAGRDYVEVPEMDAPTAADLLRKALNAPERVYVKEPALELLERLTYLPLAIIRAAAYINANDIALSKYLSLVCGTDDSVIELLSEQFEDEGRYREAKNPVATTWLISFKDIQRHDPLAADYLAFMACVEPKKIPSSLLPENKLRKRVLDAIGTLTAYSFITRRPDGKFYDMHRLVHLATRNWLESEGLLARWNGVVIARLVNIFPEYYFEDIELSDACISHTRFVLRHIARATLDDATTLLMQKYSIAAGVLSDDEAKASLTHVIEMGRKYWGQEHPHTLKMVAHLEGKHWERERLTETEDLDVQVLEKRKQVLGLEHPDTLTSLSNLAATYLQQGRWILAQELEEEALEGKRRVYGHGHPKTLVSIHNLALSYSGLGRWEEAEELGKQVLATKHRRPDILVLSSMARLASSYRHRGRYTAAVELEERIREMKKEGYHEPPEGNGVVIEEFIEDGEKLRFVIRECDKMRKRQRGKNNADTTASTDVVTVWRTSEMF
jgi:tetratricopeptide (TPR) repeat protein